MLEKIEFSDLYKFIASIGIVLIALACFYPIYLIQINILVYFKDIDPNQINIGIFDIINMQNKLRLFLIEYWYLVSGIVLVVGLLLFLTGIYNWYKRQSVLDELQDIDLAEKRLKFKTASPSEINDKNNADADEIVTDEKDRDQFIQKYDKIESSVYELFQSNLVNKKYNIKVSRNVKIGNYVYDLLIIQRVKSDLRKHIICEIKYYDKQVSLSSLQAGVSNFLLSIGNYHQSFENTVGRIVIPTLIWIYNYEGMSDFLMEKVSKFIKDAKVKGFKLRIIICNKEELAILPRKVMDFLKV